VHGRDDDAHVAGAEDALDAVPPREDVAGLDGDLDVRGHGAFSLFVSTIAGADDAEVAADHPG